MKHFYFFAIAFFSVLTAYGQTNVTMSNGTFFSCGGAFLDTGGQGGPGYSNNENFTCTICPDTPGDVVTVDFITFNLAAIGPQNSWDNMSIYDGDNTQAGTLGNYTGTQLQGLFVTATPLNTSGCLTFVFQSYAANTGGFAGTITCDTPCDRPTAVASYDAPSTHRICVGDVINFDGSASYPGAGFNITEWLWDFADGTTDDSGPVVSHSWDVPGEYVVELYLVDDNGCASTNRVSLQVLVATFPSWTPFPTDMDLCLGEQVCLEAFPDDYEVTWAGPDISYENASDFDLLDNVGECFPSEIEVAGFAPGQTLTNINDLISIDAAIEHSWLFDLVISIECPSGQSAVLHQQMSLPGGGTTGASGTNLGVPDTDWWDYSWASNAPNGTFSEVAGNGAAGDVLPTGTYSSLEPLTQLVGCDLNGTWTISFCDLWGGDNGSVTSWGLNFNPAILPDVTQFTPDIGANADSSYWSFSSVGLDILSQSIDGNSVCVQPTQEGSWPFTYSVTNNHGCTTDSTLTITATLAGQADAGPDITFCGGATPLQGGISGQPTPVCSQEAGLYSYCYDNGENTTLTFCPDNQGDGTTFMDMTFTGGFMEVFFDDITIYDGPTTASPVLAGPIEGDLTGLQFVATNPSGCISMLVSSDGSVSCTSGSFGPIEFTVGCTQGGPQYVWEWTPAEGLSDPNIPNPDVISLNGQTTYTLATYPVGHPDCVSYDEVEVFPAFDFNITSQDPSCYGNDGLISLTIEGATGTPPWTVEFYENGALQSSQISNGGLTAFQNLFPNNYTLQVSDMFGCQYDNDIVINSPPVLVFTLSNDTTICVDGAALLQTSSLMDNDNSWEYTWSGGLGFGNAVYAGPTSTTTYSVFATDDAGCDSDPMEVTVTVRDSLSVEISGPPLICGGAIASLQVDDSQGGLAPYSYDWSFNGNTIDSGENIDNQQFITGVYCAYISDACESPVVFDCFEVVVETPIDVQFVADTTRGCFPAPINFEILVDPTLFVSRQWNFGDGSFGVESAPAHLYENPGFYDVELTLTSPIGCVYSNEYNNYITVYDNPTAGYTATPQPTTMPDTEISFFDYSLGNVVEWYWVFDTLNYQGISDLQDPIFEFPMSQGGYYPVTLVVTDANGCKDQVTRWIEINDILNIFVPNAFTPNNDGVNDIFYVSGTDIDPNRFTIRVFDRWGAIVYESNNPSEIWDGSVTGGDYYTPNDVYIWQIDLYSISTAERKELSGTVIILR